MSVKMSNKSKPNNDMNETGASSEGLPPSKCPIVSRMDPVVIELLLTGGQREENGYRKRIHVIWNEMGIFNVTEQRLVDQKNNIFKRKWLSDLEL